MELEEAKKTLKFEIDFENFCMKVDHYASNEKLKTIVEAIDTVIAELDRLQKENVGKECLIETLDHNEKVKDEYIKHLEEKTRNSISKDKIREKIEELEKTGCTSYDSSTADYVQSQKIGAWQALTDLIYEVVNLKGE